QAADEGWSLLDLSSWPRYHRSHPAGAVWGLRAFLEDALALLPVERPVALLDDEHGHLAALARSALEDRGYPAVCVLEGGLAGWRAAGLPEEEGGFAMPHARADAHLLHWDLEEDGAAARRAYIDWELG